MKYTAIKVKGLSYWLWFETQYLNIKDCEFKAVKGWGKNNAYIETFECETSEIIATLTSDELGS